MSFFLSFLFLIKIDLENLLEIFIYKIEYNNLYNRYLKYWLIYFIYLLFRKYFTQKFSVFQLYLYLGNFKKVSFFAPFKTNPQIWLYFYFLFDHCSLKDKTSYFYKPNGKNFDDDELPKRKASLSSSLESRRALKQVMSEKSLLFSSTNNNSFKCPSTIKPSLDSSAASKNSPNRHYHQYLLFKQPSNNCLSIYYY